MKLNIVTGSSNSLGKHFLDRVANEDDVTIGISRRGYETRSNIVDLRADLLLKDDIQKELNHVLQSIDLDKVTSVHLFHTASKIKNEFPDVLDDRFLMKDMNNDGIDDEVLDCTFTTFKNTQTALISILEQKGCNNTPVFLNIICSLLDKKEWIPTSHASMIKANIFLRSYVSDLCIKNPHYKGVCTSVGTISTESERNYRINADHNFWLSENEVVDVCLTENKHFVNSYVDTDLFRFNPHYETYYKDETDEEMTIRFKREIGLTK